MTQPPKDSATAVKLAALCGAVVALVGLAAVAQASYGISKQAFGLLLILGLGAGLLGVAVTALDFFSSSPHLRAFAIFLTAAALAGGLGWVVGSIAAPSAQSVSSAAARHLSITFEGLARRRKLAYAKLGNVKVSSRQVALLAGLTKAFESGAADVRNAKLGHSEEKRRLANALDAVAESYNELGKALADQSGSRAEVKLAMARVEAKTVRLRLAQQALRRAGFSVEEVQIK